MSWYIMNDEMILKILLLIITFSLMLFIYAFYQLKRLKKHKDVKKSFGKDSKTLLRLYNFLQKMPLIKRYLLKVERKLKFIELSDEKTIRKKATQLILYAFAFTMVIGIILLYSVDSLYFLLLGLTMLVIVNQQFLNLYIGDMEKKLLIQFEDFLSEVKHHYHNHEMIDEAVYGAFSTKIR
jgi:Flp pilus assembly protein TadB